MSIATHGWMTRLTQDVALSFRDQFREARFKAQGDAEGFEDIVFVIERLGCFLRDAQGDLGKYRCFIIELAVCSPLFCSARDDSGAVHTPFPQLYDLVRQARNTRMHQGFTARYATSHAVEMALVLEDALMTTQKKAGGFKVSDFMVRSVACAAMWQPLSFIRQTMLANSFSSLPVNVGTDSKPEWKLVSDKVVAQYLKHTPEGVRPKNLLVQSLSDATKPGAGFGLEPAKTWQATTAIEDVLKNWAGTAVLVTREETNELLGILTPYDLL